MKKIFLMILLMANVYAYSQNIYLTRQLRVARVGGTYKLQVDSLGNGSWKTLGTEGYIQGQVSNASVDSLNHIAYRPFGALTEIPSTLSGYGISDGVNVSRSISTGFGLLGGGNLSVDRTLKADTNSTGLTTWLRTKKVADSLANLISAAGGGTVLSVSRTNGYGISASVADASVNPNITIGLDSATVSGYFVRRKDSVANGYYPYSSNPKGYLVSSDLSGYVPTTRTVNGKLLSSNITLILASSDFANQGTTTTVLHGNASGSPSFSQIVNADVSGSAGIVYSKLSLTGSIVNGDISGSAAIAYSKLNLSGSILNGDIANNTIDLGAKVTGSLPYTRLAGSLAVSLTDGATINTDASLGFVWGATFRVTLGGNRTIANPTNLVDGQRIVYELHQDATGSRTVTWGSMFMWSNDIPLPTLSTTGTYVDQVAFVYNSTAGKLYVSGLNLGIH